MAAAEKGMSVISFIQHYQRSVLKSQDDEVRLLHCLEKLHGLHVQVAHLQATGVGRTVNALRKRPGPVGEAARKLVARWKQIVEAHVSSEDEGGSELPSSTQSGDEQGNHTCDTPDSEVTSSPPTTQERKHHSESTSRYKTSENSDADMDRSHYRSPSSKKHNSSESNSKHSERSSKYKLESRENKKHESSSSKNVENNERHRSPSSKKYSHEASSSRDKTHHRSNSKNSSDSKNYDSKNSSDSKNYDSKNSSDSKNYDNKNSDSKNSSDSKNYDSKNRSDGKNYDSKNSSDSKSRRSHSSSRERSRHSESPIKDSKHKERHSKSRDKKEVSSNHRHTSSKDRKSETKIKQENGSKIDLRRIKKESEDLKVKKIKMEEPPPLTFDFVRPKIKEEPAYDSDEVAEPLELPVPRFKREDSPVIKRKIKVEAEEPRENGDESPVGASFGEALGFIDFSPSKSKSKKDKKRKNVPYSASTSSDYVKPLPRSEELAAILDLPSINPNYRPLPQVPVRTQRAPMSEHDALTAVIGNKTQRTKVYSGVKNFQGEVPSLQDMCIKILQENIDALEYIGWAPFYLMEPVLGRASAPQLANIERHNPRLSEDTDDLWHTLVKCEFRGADRQDGECWRDVYERSLEEREDKLGSLKAKIKLNNEARKAPQRTTKLAYVNTQVKPPRSVLRQQAKHGTARGSLPAPRPKPLPGDDQPGPSGQSSHASTLARTVGLLREGPSMSIKSKKRPAPLMQKTLKFMKTSYRR